MDLPQDCEHSCKLKDVCYAYCDFSIILFFSQLSKVGFCVASFPKIVKIHIIAFQSVGRVQMLVWGDGLVVHGFVWEFYCSSKFSFKDVNHITKIV